MTFRWTPADKNADVDLFQDSKRQQIIKEKWNKELQTAPWTQDISEQTLEKLEKIADSVNPVQEDFWKKKSGADILHRLNMEAQKLKE